MKKVELLAFVVMFVSLSGLLLGLTQAFAVSSVSIIVFVTSAAVGYLLINSSRGSIYRA
jgi:hypothetical protein